MSTLYNLEPQPTGKVVLHTTSGDLALELWAQQAPRTCRNFLQLCIDGYYDNTVFHRLVPDFIIQGGDPTGTGSGGESSYDGKPFEDEFHSRLKFNRRGLLGMANTGEKNDNGSQFFLTLGNTPELTGKNTMFGRIEGNTIFNLVKMGEADLVDGEGAERPLYPTRITGTDVLVNPFEGMEKRVRTAAPSQGGVPTSKKKPVKKKTGKSMLSFAGEEGDEDAPVIKTAKFNPKLVSNGTIPAQPSESATTTTTQERAPRRRMSSPTLPPAQATLAPRPQKQAPRPTISHKDRSPSPSTSPEPAKTTQESQLELANAQIAALKSSLKRNIPTSAPAKSRPKSALEAMIPATATRGRKRKAGSDDHDTLTAFTAFKSKLDAAAAHKPSTTETKNAEDDAAGQAHSAANPNIPATKPGAEDEEAALCDLHFIANCQSCTRWDRGDVDADDADGDGKEWMTHSLTFAKDRLGKDLAWKRAAEEDLVVIDPREKARDLGIKERGERRRDERGGDRARQPAREGMR